jgi:hypothetical protein
VHDEVGGVGDVVDGPLADGLQAAREPFGRGADLHAAHDARRVARAQLRVFDLDVRERLGAALGGQGFRVGLSKLGAQKRRDLARDAEVRKTVGAVRGEVNVEHEVSARFVNPVHGEPRHRQTPRQLLRRGRDLRQFA